MGKLSCFKVIERKILTSEAVPVVEIFGHRGTQLYKGSAFDVPFHVCWHTVERYEYVNHVLTIHLK